MNKITDGLTAPQIAALMAMPFKYKTDDRGAIVKRPDGYVGTAATWRALDKIGLATFAERGNTVTVKRTPLGRKALKAIAAEDAAMDASGC